jgi:hypothetical protein
MANRWLSSAVLIGVCLLSGAAVRAQSVRLIDGVFVTPRKGPPIALTAYAEANPRGILQMQKGTLEDAPYVDEVASVLVSLPNWRPVAAVITTKAAFRDELIEKRQLPISARQLNIYALRVRIHELERRDRIDALLKSLHASYDNPGYAFVVIKSEGRAAQWFALRMSPLER